MNEQCDIVVRNPDPTKAATNLLWMLADNTSQEIAIAVQPGEFIIDFSYNGWDQSVAYLVKDANPSEDNQTLYVAYPNKNGDEYDFTYNTTSIEFPKDTVGCVMHRYGLRIALDCRNLST